MHLIERETTNKKVYKYIEAWRNKPINEVDPYVYLDGISLKKSSDGKVSNVSLLVANDVNERGHRKVQGVAEELKDGAC